MKSALYSTSDSPLTCQTLTLQSLVSSLVSGPWEPPLPEGRCERQRAQGQLSLFSLETHTYSHFTPLIYTRGGPI